MRLPDIFPELSEELSRGFLIACRHDLAAQVLNLELVDRCRCGDAFCATFFTQPDQPWDERTVERFILDVDIPGLLCVHTVDGVVARVELLSRPDVRDRLREILP